MIVWRTKASQRTPTRVLLLGVVAVIMAWEVSEVTQAITLMTKVNRRK